MLDSTNSSTSSGSSPIVGTYGFTPCGPGAVPPSGEDLGEGGRGSVTPMVVDPASSQPYYISIPLTDGPPSRFSRRSRLTVSPDTLSDHEEA